MSRAAPLIGTKASTWAMFALSYAYDADSTFVGVGYMKPPFSYQRPRWIVQLLSSRADLDSWYQDLVGKPDRYHYLAAFDKTVPAWRDGKPVAAASGDPGVHVGAAPSPRDQLAHLDRLVAVHENYWVSVAEYNPHSAVMHDFLRRYWDPWFGTWMLARGKLDHQKTVVDPQGYAHEESVPARTEEVASLVREAGRGLSGLREYAAEHGIPTPDLGTARHGFVAPEPPDVASHEGGPQMRQTSSHAGWDAHVGADASYRDVASQAVRNSPPSSAYGYLRAGLHQRVYLFGSVDDASAWFGQEHDRQRVALEPVYDYLAVFASTDLHTPVAEDFGSAGTVASGDPSVGWLLPLALGIPAGALGGYYYRKWQEEHPGKILPWVSGEPWVDLVGCDQVGAYPWYDIYEPGPMILRNGPALDFVGAEPWVDIVGADGDAARRQEWPRTKALIQLAKIEVIVKASPGAPWGAPWAQAFVWRLDPNGRTESLPFATYDEALDFMRDAIHQDHVALAVFDKTSPHWPNPVNWTKNDDPAYEDVIAQQAAKIAPQGTGRGTESVSARLSREAAMAAHASTESTAARLAREAAEAAGHGTESAAAQHARLAHAFAEAKSSGVVGAWPWVDVVGLEVIGQAIDTLRRQAGVLAQEVAAPLVLVLRDGRNRWQYGKFRTPDEAIDRFSRMTSDPDLFVYAALFDKSDPRFPQPIDETIGAATPSATGAQPTIQRLLPKAA